MATVSLNLPHSIQRHLQKMADLEGVPIDQFIVSAVTEKIAALSAECHLRTRAERGDLVTLQRVLDNVPQRAPLADDE